MRHITGTIIQTYFNWFVWVALEFYHVHVCHSIVFFNIIIISSHFRFCLNLFIQFTILWIQEKHNKPHNKKKCASSSSVVKYYFSCPYFLFSINWDEDKSFKTRVSCPDCLTEPIDSCRLSTQCSQSDQCNYSSCADSKTWNPPPGQGQRGWLMSHVSLLLNVMKASDLCQIIQCCCHNYWITI